MGIKQYVKYMKCTVTRGAADDEFRHDDSLAVLFCSRKLLITPGLYAQSIGIDNVEITSAVLCSYRAGVPTLFWLAGNFHSNQVKMISAKYMCNMCWHSLHSCIDPFGIT